MSWKTLSFFERLNIYNFIATLLLSFLVFWQTCNSNRISNQSLEVSKNSLKISENALLLSEKIEQINEQQSILELKSSAGSMLTTINMLFQTDPKGTNIEAWLGALKETKAIAESQLKNLALANHDFLSTKWPLFYGRLNFDIKFIEPGLRPNVKILDIDQIIKELETDVAVIYDSTLRYMPRLRTTK